MFSIIAKPSEIKTPNLMLSKLSNIIFLTPDEHASVENDPNIYEEINIRRKEIQEHNYYE